MRKVAAFILLLALQMQTFNQVFYYVDYLVDRAAYERKCVNKYRPQLQCHGQCQMMKKMKEREERERANAPELKMNAKSEIPSSRSFFTTSLPVVVRDLIPTYRIETGDLPVDRSSAIFHPPNFS